MTTSIILDTETTDSDPDKAEVIEFAFREFDFSLSNPTFGFSRFAHFGPMAWGALAAHHILPGDLLDYPSFSLSFFEFNLLTTYWIGHNVDFDWAVCGRPPVKRICTLAMSRALWPQVDSHKLGAMTYFTKGPYEAVRQSLRDAHAASVDVDLCHELLLRICEKQGIASLDDLYEFSEDARVPKIMSFGKFKGQPVENVDRGYANWYRKQPDPDPYLLEAFRRVGLI